MKCVICKEEIYPDKGGWAGGCNPQPVEEEGRCCPYCDDHVVLPARLAQFGYKKETIDNFIRERSK